jgi:hypothetical protein
MEMMDEKSKKALRTAEGIAGTVEWSFIMECGRAAVKCGVDAFMIMLVHDGKTLVSTGNAGEDGDRAAQEYVERWSEMLQGMLSHPQIAGPGELGQIRRANTSEPCCWEVTLELDIDPGVITVRVDEFAAIDELINHGHVGWGEINMVDARLVNDDRAGRLPSVREQFEQALSGKGRHDD